MNMVVAVTRTDCDLCVIIKVGDRFDFENWARQHGAQMAAAATRALQKRRGNGCDEWRGGEWTVAAWCGDIESVTRLLGEGMDLATCNGKGS